MEIECRRTLQILYKSSIKSSKKLHKMIGIPLAMVYRTIDKIKSGEGLQITESGAERKIVGNDLWRVSQLAHSKFSSAKIDELAAKPRSPVIHPNTILNTLKRFGYLKWVPRTVLMMTKAHKKLL